MPPSADAQGPLVPLVLPPLPMRPPSAQGSPTPTTKRVSFSEELEVSEEKQVSAGSPSSPATAGRRSSSTLRASCFCGAVTLSISLQYESVSASVCHCVQCRQLTGGSFATNVVLPKEAIELLVNVEDATQVLVDQRTSPGVVRRRCARCFSPLLATLGSGRVAIPASLFPREHHPPSWAMHHHNWYEQRTIDVPDGLPKYLRTFGGVQCADNGEPLPGEAEVTEVCPVVDDANHPSSMLT